MRRISGAGMVLVSMALALVSASAETRTWSGAGGNSDWFDAANWTPNDSYPVAGDTAVIQDGARVVLSNATDWLDAVTITNAYLLFTNWTTRLCATTITVKADGWIQPITNFYGCSNNVATNPPLEMSNRVHLIARDLVVESGGYIDANGKGYRTDNTANKAIAYGPGAGASTGNRGFGGSHGGLASIGYVQGGTFYMYRRTDTGPAYDDTNAPLAPGSSGGYAYQPGPGGGPGGGAILIEATNVTVNGTIRADGGAGANQYGGGGSGGAIYITCVTFGGSNGVISSKGGARSSSNTNGGGAGGRIAVNYVSLVSRGIQFSTEPGLEHGEALVCPSQMGTVWLPDTAMLTTNLTQFNGVRLMIDGFTSWAVPSLTVSGGPVAFGDGPFTLIVTNDLSLLGGGLYLGCEALNAGFAVPALGEGTTATNPILEVGGNVILSNQVLTLGGFRQNAFTSFKVGGNLVVTNGGKLAVFSGVTNAANPEWGALVEVGGDMVVAGANSWVYPYSHPRTGGVVRFTMRNLSVTNGGFDANLKGYEWNRAVTPNTSLVPAGETTTNGNVCSGGSGYGGAGGQMTNTAGILALGWPGLGVRDCAHLGRQPPWPRPFQRCLYDRRRRDLDRRFRPCAD